LEPLKEDLSSPNKENEGEDTPAKGNDAAKEENKLPYHEDATGDSDGNPIEVKLDGFDDEYNQGMGNGIWYGYASNFGENDLILSTSLTTS